MNRDSRSSRTLYVGFLCKHVCVLEEDVMKFHAMIEEFSYSIMVGLKVLEEKLNALQTKVQPTVAQKLKEPEPISMNRN
ncbi:hypothetical protein LINPERPRIM_LOCUS2271 [Linum perenne]